MAREDNVRPLRSVTKGAESGNRRELLVALRDKLWTAFHDERTQPRDLSPLTLRLKEIQAEIEQIDTTEDPKAPAEVEDGDFDPSTV
jgi:hypothetical protein